MSGARLTGRAPSAEAGAQGDLTVTALYTAETWAWGGLPGAELLRNDDGRRVFGVTNLALALARPFLLGATSLRHGLLFRHLVIDRLLAESGAAEVLELAAGLSRRGVAATADPALRYTEVDLPGVIARKRALLERTEPGRAALARPNLRLVAADLAHAELAALPGPGRDGPLFVIAEGLFMYLEAPAQRALWGRIAALLRERGGTFVFDRVPAPEEPRAGVVGRWLGAWMRRFTKGRTFEVDERTRADLERELREAGFGAVELVEPATAPARWGLPHRDVPIRQLLFVCRP